MKPCNTLLDRDINAAINILRFGSEMLRIYLLRSPALLRNGGEASHEGDIFKVRKDGISI